MAARSQNNQMSPEQEIIFKDLQRILDEELTDCVEKGQTQRGYVQVHHGAMLPMPNECDMVYDKVYIGGEKVARDIDTLKEKGITHVVNCAQGKKFSQVDTSAEYYTAAEIKYFGIPGHDSVKFDISTYFKDSSCFIDEGCEKGAVYVHCHQGISRSAAVVIAYLMDKQHLSAAEALRSILKHRLVSPNKGFLKRLAVYQFTKG